MSEKATQASQLESALWNAAHVLRGKMDASEYKNYSPVYNSSATPWRLDQKGHEDLFLLVLAKQESRNLHDPLSD